MGPCLADMLFEGETIEEEIALSRGTVAVTTHRVLALTGEDDDKRFAHADLPNVRDARLRTRGRVGHLEWAARCGVVGILLLGGGVLFQTKGMFRMLTQAQVSGNPAVAGVGEMLSTVATWLSMLNLLLVFAGLLLAAAALGLVGLYLNTRARELVIEVAGRDSIRVSVEDDEGSRAVSRLKATI